MSRDPSQPVSDAEARKALNWLSQYVACENPDHRERLMTDLATLTVWARGVLVNAGPQCERGYVLTGGDGACEPYLAPCPVCNEGADPRSPRNCPSSPHNDAGGTR